MQLNHFVLFTFTDVESITISSVKKPGSLQYSASRSFMQLSSKVRGDRSVTTFDISKNANEMGCLRLRSTQYLFFGALKLAAVPAKTALCAAQ